MDRPDPASHFEDDADFDENPEWTEADFAKARPASEILPAHIAALLVRSDGPKEDDVVILDPDVLAKFRATGPGWQARIHAALRAAEV